MSTISTGTAPRVGRFLQHYGVQEHFTAVVGAQTTRRMKPHPEPLLFAAKAMGVDPAACLMIGDTTIDIRTGVAAQAQTVACCAGSAPRTNCASGRRPHPAHDVRPAGGPAPGGRSARPDGQSGPAA